MIAITDYGVGNLFSIKSSLDTIGVQSVVTGDADVLRSADKIILPGVGAFRDARKKLSDSGLDKVIIEETKKGKPILGICLGHQLIAKAYGGEVTTSDTESYAQVKINIKNEENLFEGLAPQMDVWSSHKDEVKTIPEEFEILASSSLCDVESFKHKDRDVYGIQFHPEVHHTPKGEIIFKNFYKICQKGV